MSILIIGCKGSMGQRYQANLNNLRQPWTGVDVHSTPDELKKELASAEAVIIATPTATHIDLIKQIIPYKKPILCEKPISTDLKALRSIIKELDQKDIPFRMMFQYSLLVRDESEGDTKYDYFRHGPDGLIWDCLQIIGLAKGKVTLADRSDLWQCMINGQKLSLADMDMAYRSYVHDWMKTPGSDLDRIVSIHEKVNNVYRNHPYAEYH